MRTVTYMSRLDAQKLDTPQNLISILCPGNDATYKVKNHNHLRIRCHDITDYISGYTLFDHIMANKILNFVNQLDSNAHLVIHCEAGISRSAAVAKFLIDKKNFKHEPLFDKQIDFSCYNSHVYGTLNRTALGELNYDHGLSDVLDRANGVPNW